MAKYTLRRLRAVRLRREQALADLRGLGIHPGGLLLVHSSLSSLGFVPGGSQEVIEILLEAVGNQGTLALPTHTWQWMNAGCRVFDVLETPSCVGKITEAFRVLPGVLRSMHPTHSVAVFGPKSREMIVGHELAATPCGKGTPYEKILNDGQILFLGTGLESNTAFHSIEAFCRVPYLLQEEPQWFTIINASRNAREILVRRHANGIARRFPSMQPFLESCGALRSGRVGPARSMLIEGATFRDVMIERLRAEPACLLEDDAHAKT